LGTTSWKTKIKNPIWRWTLGQQIQKLHFMTYVGMIERSWDVARIQTNRTMCQTLGSAWLKWAESGSKGKLAKIIWRDFRPNWPFFGEQSNISPVCAVLAYKCHTWLKSCWKGGFFGVNCFGLTLILWEQGIFLTPDPRPDPLAYTASYPKPKCARCSKICFLYSKTWAKTDNW
jgi:hypothetical protein